jgi:ABC-type Fe3+/spermidine/putrescine transport system ATPase subunit
LFPHLNVADNIGFGLADWPAAKRQARVAAMLALERFLHRHIGSELQQKAPKWMEEKLANLKAGGVIAHGSEKKAKTP